MAVQFDSVNLSIEGYQKICTEVFLALGMKEETARMVTDNLLFADLRGTNSHGIARLKQYSSQIAKGFISATAEPEVVRERGGVLVVDGHNGVGAQNGTFAMKKTIEKAKKGGLAFATVRNSSHFGVAAYYSMMALEENQIGLSFTNSLPFVAHYGSMKPCIGTNPLSITFPCGKYRPFVLDMATSVVARGNIINCAREGKDIPYGWACDETGHPTTNADAALKGYCLPLGADRNYKGSGIALSIDILCGIINGGCAGLDVRPIFTLAEDELSKGPGIGHAFAAIDIDYFMDVEEFKARMDHYIEELKKAPLAPGFEEILMPGEPEFRQYDIHTAKGSVEVALENLNEIKVITQKFCPEVNPEDYIL